MKIKDWGHIMAVLAACCLIVCGCDSRDDRELPSDKPDAVYLNINVAMADSPTSGRSDSSGTDDEERYKEPTEAEKMHTLRVILVRPNGKVEHNVFLNLENPKGETYGPISLKVQSNEIKTIYLLANESFAPVKIADSNEGPINWNDYGPKEDFLSTVQMSNLVFSWDNNATTQEGYCLPMSECYQLELDDKGVKADNTDKRVKIGETKTDITLPITRAAAKFTYEITNQSSQTYWLSNIRIDKSASCEYLLPNAMEYNDNEEVTGFQVPASAEYASFNQPYGQNVKLGAKSTEAVKLSSFYLPEGKYESDDRNDKTSYKTAITLDTKDNSGTSLGGNGGNTPSEEFALESFFPNLSALPRNTHVVVRITIRDAGDISWQVDLRPYSEVILEPGFGIEEKTGM